MNVGQIKKSGVYALAALIGIWTYLIATTVMAQASPSDSSIVVCIERSGVMKRIAPSGSCRSSSERVVLGATGPAGEKGISKAYVSNTAYSPPARIPGTPTAVHSASVSAGTYLLFMNVEIEASGNYQLTCQIQDSLGNTIITDTTPTGSVSKNILTSGSAVISEQTTLTIKCQGASNSQIIADAQIIAISLDEIE